MKRARIKRNGKQYVLPCRDNAEVVARDQECLDRVPKNASVEAVEQAVAQVRQEREEELSAGDETAVKRARIWRSGKYLYMPRRTSLEAVRRDQEVLDAVDKNCSLEEAEERVAGIRRQREQEISRGEPGGSSQAEKAVQRKRPRRSFGKAETVHSIDKALLEGQHRQMCEEASRHESMKCFHFRGMHTSYTLLRDNNINVFPWHFLVLDPFPLFREKGKLPSVCVNHLIRLLTLNPKP